MENNRLFLDKRVPSPLIPLYIGVDFRALIVIMVYHKRHVLY
jgi:hypothetical protein